MRPQKSFMPRTFANLSPESEPDLDLILFRGTTKAIDFLPKLVLLECGP